MKEVACIHEEYLSSFTVYNDDELITYRKGLILWFTENGILMGGVKLCQTCFQVEKLALIESMLTKSKMKAFKG
jgi:hypothetical protein